MFFVISLNQREKGSHQMVLIYLFFQLIIPIIEFVVYLLLLPLAVRLLK